MWIIPFLAVSVTATSIEDLRTDLDAISPGSADWFIQWGNEQATMDTISRLVDDETSVAEWNDILPNNRELQPPIFTYAILSQYPEISPQQFHQKLISLCERHKILYDIGSIERQYAAATMYTRVPLVVHEAMKQMWRQENFSLNSSVGKLSKEIHADKNLMDMMVGEGESQKRADIRLRTKLTFWFLFCVRDDSAVYQSDGFIIATTETKFAIFEHMLLVVLRKRSSTGRMF